MKRLDIPSPSNGHRFFPPDDMMHIMESIQEFVLGFAPMFGDTYYLQDTEIAIGTDAECDAGAMIYKGEFCLFDAQSVAVVGGQTLYWVPETTYRACDPIVYADASNQFPHPIKKVKLQYAAAPPADYVEPANVLSRSEALIAILDGSWQGLFFQNGWDDVGTFKACRYRRNANGKVELEGAADKGSSSIMGNLPAGYRPPFTVHLPIAVFGGGADMELLTIEANGDMTVTTGKGYNNYSLEGISFYIA
jgi:hypothetical protein